MKRFNHIWIFSDSIAGHEIQSQALASKLSSTMHLFHCTLRQPWLSFAPRVLPRFGKNIVWENQTPDISNPPDAIITCGRRMAAIGKYYKRQLHCKHIQILNPTDNPKKYDILVCPEHDEVNGKNVITSKGSLHNISMESLAKIKCSGPVKGTLDTICLLLGNPAKGFFKELEQLEEQIKQSYPEHDLHVCGSRRTPKKYYSAIKNTFSTAKSIWLTEIDGDNPYLKLLACSESIIVTADSINMVSEACATDKCVIAIAQNYISPKHKRFIASIDDRLSDFKNLKENHVPLDTLDIAAQKIIELL